MSELKEVRVLLGVTGGIAVYKAAALTSRLRQAGALVRVIMTANAQRFVTPLTFEALSGHPVYRDMWERAQDEIEHIAAADWAQLVVIAPATNNILAKVAHGICDDLLSTVICATRGPVLFAPAATTTMWENPINQDNVTRLKELGYRFVGPEEGWLACDKTGPGRMAEPETILEAIRSLAADL